MDQESYKTGKEYIDPPGGPYSVPFFFLFFGLVLEVCSIRYWPILISVILAVLVLCAVISFPVIWWKRRQAKRLSREAHE